MKRAKLVKESLYEFANRGLNPEDELNLVDENKGLPEDYDRIWRDAESVKPDGSRTHIVRFMTEEIFEGPIENKEIMRDLLREKQRMYWNEVKSQLFQGGPDDDEEDNDLWIEDVYTLDRTLENVISDFAEEAKELGYTFIGYPDEYTSEFRL